MDFIGSPQYLLNGVISVQYYYSETWLLEIGNWRGGQKFLNFSTLFEFVFRQISQVATLRKNL